MQAVGDHPSRACMRANQRGAFHTCGPLQICAASSPCFCVACGGRQADDLAGITRAVWRGILSRDKEEGTTYREIVRFFDRRNFSETSDASMVMTPPMNIDLLGSVSAAPPT